MTTTLKAQSKAASTLFFPARRSSDSRAEFARPLLRRNLPCVQPADDTVLAAALQKSASVSSVVGIVSDSDLDSRDAQRHLDHESISASWPLSMAATVDDDDEEEEDEDLDDEDDDLEDDEDLEDEEDGELEDEEDEEDEDYEDLDEDEEDEDDDEEDE